jgi:hypothetical protein
VRLDAFSGASAGGMCATIASVMVCNQQHFSHLAYRSRRQMHTARRGLDSCSIVVVSL